MPDFVRSFFPGAAVALASTANGGEAETRYIANEACVIAVLENAFPDAKTVKGSALARGFGAGTAASTFKAETHKDGFLGVMS